MKLSIGSRKIALHIGLAGDLSSQPANLEATMFLFGYIIPIGYILCRLSVLFLGLALIALLATMAGYADVVEVLYGSGGIGLGFGVLCLILRRTSLKN